MKEYSRLNDILVRANETEIFELTGCLSTCEKYEYFAQPRVASLLKTPSEKDKLQVGFVFKSGRHERKEQVCNSTFQHKSRKKYYLQYNVYDFNAFVADVGGYLGLLLGHSIFGMFEPIIKFISKCPSWMGGFRKKCTSRGPNEVAPLSTKK